MSAVQVTREDAVDPGTYAQAGVVNAGDEHGFLVVLSSNTGKSVWLTPQDAREYGQYVIEMANQADQRAAIAQRAEQETSLTDPSQPEATWDIRDIADSSIVARVQARGAKNALDVYSADQGFAPYAEMDDPSPDAIKPYVLRLSSPDGTIVTLGAVFTNTEIYAVRS